MTNAAGYPSFESVYLLTQRNAEAIQKLGEKLDEMAVREEERDAKRKAEDANRKAEQDKATKEMRRRTNKLEELFTSQWGKLVEALVDGKVVELLNERGMTFAQP